MQAASTRRWKDSEGDPKSGGPGGLRQQGAPDISDEDRSAIRALYLKGAAARYVIADGVSITTLRNLREASLIDTLADVRNKTTAKLTARGLAELARSPAIAGGPGR